MALVLPPIPPLPEGVTRVRDAFRDAPDAARRRRRDERRHAPEPPRTGPEASEPEAGHVDDHA